MCKETFQRLFDVEDPIPSKLENDYPHNPDLEYRLYNDSGLNRNLFNHINKNINKVKLLLMYNIAIVHIGLYYYYYVNS